MTQHATPAPLASADTPVEVIRSEEQLRTSTRSVVTERVRLVKRVVSEERVITVTVRREELVVEHLPETDLDTPASDDARSAEGQRDRSTPVLELVLSEEEVEVVTRVVPRERVRVFLDTVSELVEVSDELAREVVDVDAPDDSTRTR